MSFASVYALYIAKVERKDRTQAELDQVILWFTGLTNSQFQKHLKSETNFEEFFGVTNIHQNASLITGSICGVKIDEIEDPLMKKIRQLDKLVDELAKGRPLEKILRK
jgi:hypothetical protein